MQRALFVLLASILLLAPAAVMASDGGQASLDPTSLKGPKCPRLPDDINLGGGLYMCARMDCSPPPGFTEPPGCGSPQRNVVLVPNGDLTLNANGDIVGVSGSANSQASVQNDGGSGYDGAQPAPPN